jgi:predicted Zn finger-like uncharacterized protein
MVIACENCKSKFKLDDALIKDLGSKVRCSSCRHVFTVYKPAPVEDTRSASGLDENAVGQPEEITEEPLDFDLFESEKDQDEGLSLEDFGLGEDDSGPGTEGTSEKDDVAKEEQITADDLGFGDALLEEGASESGHQTSLEGLSLQDGPPDTKEATADKAEADEEISFEDLTIEDESWAAEAAQGDEPDGVAEAEEEVSFQDLNLEEEPVVAEETAPGAELKMAEMSQEEISFDDMDFEDASPEKTSPEEAIVEEDKADWAQHTAGPLPEGVPVASLEEGDEVEEEDTFEDMAVPPPVAEQASRGSHVSMPLLIALIAVLIAGGAYAGFTFLKGGNIKVPFLESIAGVGGDEQVDPGNLRVTLLEDLIAGEFVDNSKIGRLFVIKGKIRSDYPDMRNFIKMKGTVYLRDGKVAADQVIYCGNVLTDTELQTLDREAIKKRITNRFGDNKANFKVPSGKILPFMVVFTDIPQDLGEFSVEVVDSLAA